MIDLTIGMAAYDEWDGVWFTIQALRIYHAEVLKRLELIVVDNNPNSEHGKMVADFMRGWVNDVPARYIPFTDAVGTSAPRNHVFTEAAGKYVLCMDSHVMLPPGVLGRLLDYYDANPETRDLISGPMYYNDNSNYSTHFDLSWRAEMWGIWGKAWRLQGWDRLFSVHGDQHGHGWPLFLGDESPSQPAGWPRFGYSGHEIALANMGGVCLGDLDEPFEIPAQGLGLFTCRKDAWLGFNKNFRGFGGEECYIHTKFRQAGAKCLCLPWLRWHHRFGRPSGVPYPLTRWNKVRNYVIGHAELGLDFEPVKKHFLDTGLIPPIWWEILMKNPSNPPESPDIQQRQERQPTGGCGPCGKQQPVSSLDELFKVAASQPSDINEHCLKLKELAAQAAHVTEFGHRPQASTVALLAGQPNRFITYYSGDNSAASYMTIKGNTDFVVALGDSLVTDIEETDLLLIDTKHTADHLWMELERHAGKVRKRMVFHDTAVFGEKGEDGGPGLLPALRRFLKDNKEWSVIYHTDANNGLTVVSRDPTDKPPLPSVAKQVWNFAGALSRMAASKVKGHELLVSEEVAEKRLDICALCPIRNDDRCSKCGCFIQETPQGLPGKAMLKTEDCPLGKWFAEE